MDQIAPTSSTKLILRAGASEAHQRQAGIFLFQGTYRLDLVPPPDGGEDPDDSHGWSYSDNNLYINEFYVYSPAFNFEPEFKDRRRFFGSGGRYVTKKQAICAFMALPENARTICIPAEHATRGRPVFFFINDEKDNDNRGGLTIQIIPV